MKASALTTGLSLATLSLSFFATTAFAQETSCMQRAIADRQTDLSAAYADYADAMSDAVTRLSTDEKDGLKQDNQNYRTSDAANALSNFTYSTTANWQQLSARLSQIWNEYNRERYQCGYSQVAPASYGGGNYYNYGNRYNQGYYNRSYYNSYNARSYCPAPQTLGSAPSGCSYQCSTDGYGCRRCTLSCDSDTDRRDCDCPSVLSPVCTTNNRTYNNACLAVCDGESVWHQGGCRR